MVSSSADRGLRLRAAANRAAGPVVTAVLSMLAMAQALRLWDWRPGTPLGLLGDAPWTATLIRTYVDHGAYANNPLFGAPFSLNTGWASTGDEVHIWILSALGGLTSDPFTVMGLYFFLCFPLSALAMYWLCRRHGVIRPAAVALGVLFSVVPGHQERFAHLFLAAYWAVPYAVHVVIETAQGRSVLGRGRADRGNRPAAGRRHVVAAGAMLVLIGLGDVYYVAFTLILAAVVLLLRQVLRRDLRELLRLSVPLVTIAVPTLVSLWFARSRAKQDEVTGGMAFGRTVADSDRWSGRILDLILPWDGHRVPFLGSLSDAYNLVTDTYGETSALGVIALVGVVGLLAVAGSAALTQRRLRPGGLLTALVVALLVTVGFYTKGGLGSWFALFLTPQIRTWSRLFLFVAVIGLLAVGVWLSQVGTRRRRRPLSLALAALVVVVGVWDQTNPGRAPDYVALRAELGDLRTFDDSVQATLGAGCTIFTLPVVQFPEVDDASVAQFLSLGLASDDLRWSFGAIKGTAQADWQLALTSTDAGRLLDDLSAVGFCGVVLHDSTMTRSPALAAGIAQQLGGPIATSAGGTFTAYDLRARRDALATRLGPVDLPRRREEVLRPVVVALQGVWREDAVSPTRFPLGPTPSLQVSNLSGMPQTVRLVVSLGGARDGVRTVTLDGLGRTSAPVDVAAGGAGQAVLTVEVPPGRSAVEVVVRPEEPGLSAYARRADLPFVVDVSAVLEGAGTNVGVSLPPP
ncbi:MAG: hypothetical protein ABIS35_14245 [Terracoccus sp.]